jgi:hypothetical protein
VPNAVISQKLRLEGRYAAKSCRRIFCATKERRLS